MGSEYATGGAVRTEDYGAKNGGIDTSKGGRRSRKGLVKAGVDWLGEMAGDVKRIAGMGKKERGF